MFLKCRCRSWMMIMQFFERQMKTSGIQASLQLATRPWFSSAKTTFWSDCQSNSLHSNDVECTFLPCFQVHWRASLATSSPATPPPPSTWISNSTFIQYKSNILCKQIVKTCQPGLFFMKLKSVEDQKSLKWGRSEEHKVYHHQFHSDWQGISLKSMSMFLALTCSMPRPQSWTRWRKGQC